MTYDVPVQMTVSEGFGPVPAPAPQILIINAEAQNIGGVDFLVLDKTFSEIRNSPFCVIKYSAAEWGTGYGVTARWYVYDIQETPMLIRASVWSGNSPELITFEALSDSDYPKQAI